MSELFDLTRREQFPLFITEGTSEWKLARINRNDYLRFCYEKLGRIKDGLVVLGHSLHKDFDQHIIDTVKTSNASRIAIGVWPHQNDEAIVSFKARLAQYLPNKERYFFNSQTHPLGAISLNVSLE